MPQAAERRPEIRSSGSRPQSRFLRHIHKLHLDLLRHLCRARRRLLRERILSLLAVGQADRRAQFVLRDVLKARQDARGRGSNRRTAGRRVKDRIRADACSGFSFRACWNASIAFADTAWLARRTRPGNTRCPRRSDRSRLPGETRRLRLSRRRVLAEQSEVIPGVGIVGVLLHRLFQQRPGGIDPCPD